MSLLYEYFNNVMACSTQSMHRTYAVICSSFPYSLKIDSPHTKKEIEFANKLFAYRKIENIIN